MFQILRKISYMIWMTENLELVSTTFKINSTNFLIDKDWIPKI
jgi:hypothetical protein